MRKKAQAAAFQRSRNCRATPAYASVDDAGALQDDHFYRHDNGGTWSGKTYLASNQDASGNLLLDPRTADADFGAVGADRLNYSRFVGFFAVLPGATVGPEAAGASEPPSQ